MAGITILSLTGENGLITKTKSAKLQQEISSAEESIKIEYSEYLTYDSDNKGEFLEYLNSKNSIYIVDLQNKTVNVNELLFSVIINENEELIIEHIGQKQTDTESSKQIKLS